MKLRALRSMRYGTRRLEPGEQFDAKPKDARILKALRKAENASNEPKATTVQPKTETPPVTPAASPGPDMPATIDEFRALSWQERRSLAASVSDAPIKSSDDAERAYTEAAAGRYQRRDLRAED